MEKISGVYKITNTVTGDFYVGSSKNVMKRWANHKYLSTWGEHPNNPMYQDMQKYGLDKFRFQILGYIMPECLKQVEQDFIEMLKPTYNTIRAKGWNVEMYKECQKEYHNQLCSYNGKTLTLNALLIRFKRAGIPHPVLEAKKYLLNQQ